MDIDHGLLVTRGKWRGGTVDRGKWGQIVGDGNLTSGSKHNEIYI